MNVRLKDEFFFTAGVWFDNQFLMNNYQVHVKSITNTTDADYINVARSRIQWLLRSGLQSSVFVNQTWQDKIAEFNKIGITTVVLPEEPVDQIIGLMLYCKLNAITEEKLLITDVDVTSELGDNCWYLHNQNESVGPFSEKGWWHLKDPIYFDQNTKNKRVIKLHNTNTWRDLELDWPSESNSQATVTPFK
jgi:hypothetical protein